MTVKITEIIKHANPEHISISEKRNRELTEAENAILKIEETAALASRR